RMGLECVEELEPVLDGPQEDVGVGQCARLLPGEVATLGQPVEGTQAVPLLEPRVLGPVEELEGLEVELDLADPAGAQLDVALLAPARPERAVDPRLDRADLAD